MRTALAFAAILAGVWVVSPEPASAFQEVPVPAPERQLSIPGQDAARGGVTFSAPAQSVTPKSEAGKGSGLGSLEMLPKLNFGLELLYGSSKDDAALNSPAEPSPSSDDVQILGTVKRRF